MTREGQRNITKERVEEGNGRRGGERERGSFVYLGIEAKFIFWHLY